jgi:dolichol-phosphate mannosyltransferase
MKPDPAKEEKVCPCAAQLIRIGRDTCEKPDSEIAALNKIPYEINGLISIIVPTFQEAENLKALTYRIADAMSLSCENYEIIIVDDNSQDNSDKMVSQLAKNGHPIRMIIRMNERGLSSAVIRGFREAEGDFLVCMDADLSHPPEGIPRLLKCIMEDGINFAIGSRYVPGASMDKTWSAFRWINSKVATLLAKPFTTAKDPMSGFFALPRDVFERADKLDPIGYKIGLELLVKCSIKNICEIPIHFSNRRHGKSKLNLKEQINYIRHLKRLFRYKYGRFFL